MGKTHQSPFKVPEDESVFLLTAREKEHRTEEMRRYLSLPVHEKMSLTGRLKAKQRELRRELSEQLDEEEEEEEGSTMRPNPSVKGQRGGPTSTALRMAMIKRENIEKESMQDFINNKRELLLLEYSLMVKRAEIRKLEDATVEEERRTKMAEQLLEDDTLLFEEFLKENDKNSVEAIQIAEKETKCKLKKMAEIKRLTTEMVTIKSDISKNEEILKEYNMYKDFLFKLSPPEWQEVQRTRALDAKVGAAASGKDAPGPEERKADTVHRAKRSLNKRALGNVPELPPIRDARLSSGQRLKSSTSSSSKLTAASNPSSDDSEHEEEPELYFTHPQQIVDLLSQLEEQNLSLIQNSRETEKALEELQHSTETSKKKMAKDAQQLSRQIDIMSQTIATEKERAGELELKTRLYNFGKSKSADEDATLDALGRKVEEVYRCCVGDRKGNPGTLQMLAVIESRISELLESMESIPRDTLEKVEKMKERERRMRQRDQKQQQQKQHQEERLRKALERAQADIRRTNGRKLMARSEPVARKIKFNNVHSVSEQEEVHAFFFT